MFPPSQSYADFMELPVEEVGNETVCVLNTCRKTEAMSTLASKVDQRHGHAE